MKIRSLARQGVEFVLVEVEVTLMPGLPVMHIMGLPDAATKEGAPRVKAALVQQGFHWPRAQQILVNLHPSHVRKSSRGLDLAIAVGILRATGQIGAAVGERVYYGELGLDGSVLAPDDLFQVPQELVGEGLVTGVSVRPHNMDLWSVTGLRDLEAPVWQKGQAPDSVGGARPQLPDMEFSALAAELLAIVASGEHATMVAGPAGSGKSTWVEALYKLLDEPDPALFSQAQGWARLMGRELTWRPFVSPHHSTPPLTMLGGGHPPVPGEITRAHSGLLFLDEYLEFDPKVQEALREPLEKGEICISRRGSTRVFPARFMCVAATNLCPCGSLAPGQPNRCQFSLGRCRSHLQRLSGPMLDRFDILAFSHKWRGVRKVLLTEVRDRVKQAQAVRRTRDQSGPNAWLTVRDLEARMAPFVRQHLLPSQFSSERRKRALLRVARTVADLAGSEILGSEHISRALELTVEPFTDIDKIFA